MWKAPETALPSPSHCQRHPTVWSTLVSKSKPTSKEVPTYFRLARLPFSLASFWCRSQLLTIPLSLRVATLANSCRFPSREATISTYNSLSSSAIARISSRNRPRQRRISSSFSVSPVGSSSKSNAFCSCFSTSAFSHPTRNGAPCGPEAGAAQAPAGAITGRRAAAYGPSSGGRSSFRGGGAVWARSRRAGRDSSSMLPGGLLVVYARGRRPGRGCGGGSKGGKALAKRGSTSSRYSLLGSWWVILTRVSGRRGS
ncbi:hypothetical protein BU16DRAFT_322072 [Lophium mytilinum]|uniref:Uncharacterized protein n=1 Tax=Lophium mytilinum TaxID=390894 RepID=A0A6A6R1H9_9PEZI|nr:hypothetical protein BU16DRAFT_322072 [Lophium mytilinum]